MTNKKAEGGRLTAFRPLLSVYEVLLHNIHINRYI